MGTEETLNELVETIKRLETKVDAIDQGVNGFSSSYKLYKGAGGGFGVVQFDLTPKHQSKKELGVVFLQAAPATNKNVYDWDNKITMALSMQDITTILGGLRDPNKAIELYHDRHKGTHMEGSVIKTLHMTRGQKGGFFLNLYMKDQGKEQKISVPLSDADVSGLAILLRRALVRILGW